MILKRFVRRSRIEDGILYTLSEKKSSREKYDSGSVYAARTMPEKLYNNFAAEFSKIMKIW